jgi:CRISPR/Cas system Type II protein with McrA/HNH and RuvC-like nuclease domain
MRKKNYYAFQGDFKKSINKLIIRRLKSDLKVKLYSEQKGLCLVCKENINEDLLLSRYSKLRIHHLVPYSIATEIKLNQKFYESRQNKVLLHEKCHLILNKSNLFQDSYLLRTSVPKKSIIS